VRHLETPTCPLLVDTVHTVAIMAAGKRMRIAIDGRIAYYSSGGLRRYVVLLLQALAGLDSETDYLVLHSRKQRSPRMPGANFRPVRCWTPSHHPLERWAMALEVARLRPELLHSPDFIPPAFGYRRSVVTVQDLSFLRYPHFLTAQSRRYYNRQIRWAVARTDHILAISKATQRDLCSLLGVDPRKITVAYLAADPELRPPAPEEVKQLIATYGLEQGYLLFVGTLEPRKNLPGLLEAYRALLDRGGVDPPLVLAGRVGWLHQEVLDCVQRLRLEKHVRVLNQVADADLAALYAGAGVLALPSFYEGFGLPALEAMACGTPVVAARRGALPEVVGDSGLLVEPDDTEGMASALEKALLDRRLRARLRQSGMKQASRFTWDRTAAKTLEVYRSVVAS
jgi:glycosyltransferase involved in cell wall biosynthesis